MEGNNSLKVLGHEIYMKYFGQKLMLLTQIGTATGFLIFKMSFFSLSTLSQIGNS
jgi:hypothetical protein